METCLYNIYFVTLYTFALFVWSSPEALPVSHQPELAPSLWKLDRNVQLPNDRFELGNGIRMSADPFFVNPHLHVLMWSY